MRTRFYFKWLLLLRGFLHPIIIVDGSRMTRKWCKSSRRWTKMKLAMETGTRRQRIHYYHNFILYNATNYYNTISNLKEQIGIFQNTLSYEHTQGKWYFLRFCATSRDLCTASFETVKHNPRIRILICTYYIFTNMCNPYRQLFWCCIRY